MRHPILAVTFLIFVVASAAACGANPESAPDAGPPTPPTSHSDAGSDAGVPDDAGVDAGEEGEDAGRFFRISGGEVSFVNTGARETYASDAGNFIEGRYTRDSFGQGSDLFRLRAMTAEPMFTNENGIELQVIIEEGQPGCALMTGTYDVIGFTGDCDLHAFSGSPDTGRITGRFSGHMDQNTCCSHERPARLYIDAGYFDVTLEPEFVP